jgi:hypothetical protein
MNETPRGSAASFGFEQRLLEELRLSISSGAFVRRREKKGRKALLTRRHLIVIFAAGLLLIAATAALAAVSPAVRSLFADSEKIKITHELERGQHIGPEVASVGPYKLYAAPSAHAGLISVEFSSSPDESSATYVTASNPLSVSGAFGSSDGVLFGRVDPDRVATLKLELGSAERLVPLSLSGYFIEPLDSSDVSAIEKGKAELAALNKQGGIVKIRHLSMP